MSPTVDRSPRWPELVQMLLMFGIIVTGVCWFVDRFGDTALADGVSLAVFVLASLAFCAAVVVYGSVALALWRGERSARIGRIRFRPPSGRLQAMAGAGALSVAARFSQDPQPDGIVVGCLIAMWWYGLFCVGFPLWAWYRGRKP